MSGCEGCFLTAKAMAAALDTIRKQARQYAATEKTTVVIYKEAGEYRFIRADLSGGLPVVEYISVAD